MSDGAIVQLVVQLGLIAFGAFCVWCFTKL
jgi:hypothetical protein